MLRRSRSRQRYYDIVFIYIHVYLYIFSLVIFFTRCYIRIFSSKNIFLFLHFIIKISIKKKTPFNKRLYIVVVIDFLRKLNYIITRATVSIRAYNIYLPKTNSDNRVYKLCYLYTLKVDAEFI